jgi:2,3-bisphosphoglycerate-dependent phosphoglycerate mutase
MGSRLCYNTSMETGLVLVRHAESVRPAAGGPDESRRPLTASGMEAARALAPGLLDRRPTAVVSSPYLRAVQTVQPVASELGIEVDTRWNLREWDSALAPAPDYAVEYARSWARPDLARPGGESLEQLSRRAASAIIRVANGHRGGVVIVGSHGTFISRALAAFGLAVDWPFHRDMPMPALFELRFASDAEAPTIAGPGLTA